MQDENLADDLPEELKKQLVAAKNNLDDDDVIKVLGAEDHPLTLNEILIGCYHLRGTVYTRRAMHQRLYRMIKKGKLRRPDKGVWELSE